MSPESIGKQGRTWRLMPGSENAMQSQDIPNKPADLVMQGSAGTLCCQEGKTVLFLSMYHSKAVFLQDDKWQIFNTFWHRCINAVAEGMKKTSFVRWNHIYHVAGFDLDGIDHIMILLILLIHLFGTLLLWFEAFSKVLSSWLNTCGSWIYRYLSHSKFYSPFTPELMQEGVSSAVMMFWQSSKLSYLTDRYID